MVERGKQRRRGGRNLKGKVDADGVDPLVGRASELGPIDEHECESDEDTVLGGESARESDEEYFILLSSACAGNSGSLSEMIARGVVTAGHITLAEINFKFISLSLS